MLERVTDAFYALDDEFRFTHVNEAATKFLQHSEEELLGEKLWDLFPEAAEIDDVWDAFHRALEEQETTGYELYYPPLDLWVDATIYPSESGVSVYFQDIRERKERERKLRESQQRYRSLTEDVLDSSEVGTIILDADLQVEWANRRIGEFFDIDREELVGSDEREEIWGTLKEAFEDPDRFEAELMSAYEDGGEIANFECHVTPADGRPERWLEHWSKPIETGLFEGGRIEHYYDITEQKRSQRELRESEAKFRTLAENLAEVAWMSSEDPTDLLYVNPTYEEVWGIDREEVYDETLSFLDGVHPDDRDRVREGYTGLPEEEYDEQFRVVQPDGEVRWVHARAVPVHDEEGDVFRIVGIAEDITERRRFEAKLAESERKHRTLVENFPNGAVGMFDEDLRYTVVGGKLLEDVGLDPSDIVGQSLLERYPPDVLDVAEPRFRGALEGEASRFEIEFHDRQLLAHTIPVRDAEDEIYAGLLVVQDITDRKQAQQQLRESEELYRTLAENFPNGGIGVFDEDLRYTLVEGTMWSEIEPDADDLEGRTIWEALSPQTAEDLEPVFRSALEGEQGTGIAQLGGRIYRFWATPLQGDAGEVTAGLSFSLDITDQLERERELEESRRRYQTLVENFPNGAVALVDEDIRYRMVGGEPPEALGLTIDELEGQRVAEIFPEPLASQLTSRYERAFQHGERDSFEQSLGDQAYRFHVLPVRDAQGEIFAALGMSQDVTREKKREQRLREAKSQLEAATEAGAVGTWEWHIPDDRMVSGSAMAEIFDVDPARARAGTSLDRFASAIHEADRERVGAAVDEAMETCGAYEQEYRVQGSDGEVRWVVARGHVECDEEGNPVSFPGALTDITERKQAEIQLEQTKDQLESLFAILPVGVVVGDEEGRIVEANETAEQMLPRPLLEGSWDAGTEAIEVRVADTGDPVGPDEWTMTRLLDGETIEEPDVFTIEDGTGVQRVLMIDGAALRETSEGIRRAVLTLTDITERRGYRRRLEESNERLEQFAYAASHDLQEPLRMVSTYLQLIEQRYGDQLDEEGEEFFDYAIDGAQRMREMIRSLLAYSRVTSEGQPLEPVDAGAVFEDACSDLQLQIEETDAEVTVGDLPRVEADPDQLAQVFRNLLSNALTYSGDEPPRVHVEAEPADGDEWRFAVRDEGVGIPAEHTDRVFEVFRRLEGREESSGAGIGLAICQQIVDRHGGRMWVESEPGEGSVFSFTLPAAD